MDPPEGGVDGAQQSLIGYQGAVCQQAQHGRGQHQCVKGLWKGLPKRLDLVIEALAGRIPQRAAEVARATTQAMAPMVSPKGQVSTSTYPCLTQTGVSPRLTV